MMWSSSRILQSTVSRALIGLFDAAWITAIAFVLLLGTVQPAYAYVDPSVMTYTIQALAGVAVALSAVMGVVWRRIRRHLMRFLRIDENANKQVDTTIHAINEDSDDYQERLERAKESARQMKSEVSKDKPEQLYWGARFFFALAASIMLCFTVMLASPLEIVAASGLSLLFIVNDVWAPLLLAAVIASIILALLLSLLRGRAFGIAFAVVIALGLGAYIQVMFLNTGLPPADGTHVEWDKYTKITLLSAAVWIALFAGAIILSIEKSLLFKGVSSMLCAVCLIAQGISLGMLFTTPNAGALTPLQDKPTVTMEGMLNVSNKDNVIMIVLDTYDVSLLLDVLRENPQALDEFTGFTCYTNTTGSMIPTRYAMSSLLTGKTLTDENDCYSNEVIVDWYTNDNLIDTINAQGYQTDIYATDIPDAIESLSKKVNNIHALDKRIDPVSTVGVLLKCSIYRCAPWVLKPPFWFYTDEINNAVLIRQKDDLSQTTWNIDDAGYYQLLKEQGLSQKDIGNKGSYRVLHFSGAHSPFLVDRNGNRLAEEGTQLEQCMGSLVITSEYLKQLKQLGVYDDATIIVTADHGDWYLADDIYRPTCPILLAKPRETSNEASEPVKFSSVPTGHVDVAATLLTAIGADPTIYGGQNMFDVTDANRPRYYNATSVRMPDAEYYAIKQWKIDGNSLDWNSWSLTGKEWPIK